MNRCLYCLYCIVVLFGCGYSSSAQIISNFAGIGTVGFTGDGGPATNAQLDSSTCLALDGLGNIYINDQLNHSIRKVNPSGIISTVAGTGAFGFTGDNGPATAARLNGNWGVAADAAGNIFITDQFNYRVRKVNLSGQITTIAGTGTPGYSGDGGAATGATFRKPLGIAVDNTGNIYVGDADNYCIRRIDAFGTITTYVGTGTAGFSGDNGPATAARIGYVWGLATDAVGALYICDGGNHRVRKVTPGGIISTIAGTGAVGFSGDSGPATAASFNLPVSVSVAGNGAVVIADGKNNRIRRIDLEGVVRTIAGTGVAGYNGEGIPATSARIFHPSGVLVDTGENVYISDMRNVRIRKVINVLSFILGDDAALEVCQNSAPVPVNDLLAVRDVYVGLPDVWTLHTPPAHGAAIVGYSATSSGSIITPAGLTYQPDAGYTGNDSFEVKVANSLTSDLIKIYVTVDPLLSPGVISGPDRVCVGDTITFSNAVSGGTWSVVSGDLGIVSSDIYCAVRGESAGVDTIKYMVTNACGVAATGKTIVIDPLPDPGVISGPSAFCRGTTVNFIASASGGTWSTSNLNTTVNALGQVKGVAEGTSVIIYTVYNTWCRASAIRQVAVEVFPDAGIITGPLSVCLGSQITLSDTIAGGTWSSSFGYASVSNGLVTGVSVGNDFVNYSVTNTCGTDIATRPITIHPVPAPPDISVLQGVMYADKGYDHYQWLLNTISVPGATADTLYALETGIYEVVVTNSSGCSTVSGKLNYSGCNPDDIEIMPNPVSGELSIVWCRKVTAVLLTIDGRTVGRADEVRRIVLSTLPSGFYILNVYDHNKNKVKSLKIVKM